ncbi:hypothetical protein MJA45_13410 [Paenibacillus aurantius]|uniref:Uncharacterized protein n=1 Tax=Paenibacillus aurantius TaxID=2918900 RepID=A0AA96LII9_9BACL|nr:hypothetical protein [Paenibacillus aurantius]WNQ13969.1 hypothetical protein MJA45_13410 [Paenibacillus aurantius]
MRKDASKNLHALPTGAGGKRIFRYMLIISMICAILAQTNPVDAGTGTWIGTTDSTTKKMHVYDAAVTDWNSDSAIKWEFAPSTALGFTASEINAWNGGSGMKLRNSSVWGGAMGSRNGFFVCRHCFLSRGRKEMGECHLREPARGRAVAEREYRPCCIKWQLG